MPHHLNGHRHFQAPVDTFIDDAVSPTADNVCCQILTDYPICRRSSGIKAIGHEFGKKVKHFRITSRNILKLGLIEYPHIHVSFGLGMCVLWLSGKNRQLSHNISFAPVTYRVELTFLFH